MSSERRIHPRRVLYSPEYLDMGVDNGGVVVNLSEGGLAFQAVSPVASQSEIPLSFSLGPGYRIDVRARVVWVNAEGKLGGAVFGKLSKDSHSLIREWLAKSDAEHESENAIVEPAAARGIEGAAESAPPVNPHPSAVATQIADAMSAEGTAAGNGTPLTFYDTISSAERSPTGSSAGHGITSRPMPTSDAVARDRSAPPPPTQQKPAVPAAQAPRAQALTPPARVPEPRRERSSGASYSLAPSIGMWGTDDSQPATRTARPTFPPRNAENIFARSPSRIDYERRRRGSGALVIFAIVIAAAAVGVFYARTYRQQIGNEITQIGNFIAGAPAAATTIAGSQASTATPNTRARSARSRNASASPAKPVQIPPPVPSQAPVVGSSSEQSASQSATSVPNASASDSATPPATQAVQPTRGGAVPEANPSKGDASPAASTAAPSSELGQVEYQRAENYLNGKGVPQDSAQAAEWFWRSLEAGNTSAAIPLADLYIAGNGVSRSCTQARILLDAAAQKNNTTAIKRLAELPESCH